MACWNRRYRKVKCWLVEEEQAPGDGIAAAVAVERKLGALVEEQAYNHWKEL